LNHKDQVIILEDITQQPSYSTDKSLYILSYIEFERKRAILFIRIM